ncbi:hypothetical protein CDD83_10725 [Cordyceps sp. RAO-2017]|nr:hypothetical protein CDD83_10725 [Cordyceps sp. RAO-2017]
MAEGIAATGSDAATAAAQRASEQARLRKERREAKIKAGGSARLNKITGIGGRVVGETEQATPVVRVPPPAPKAAAAAAANAADPEEVDISEEHFHVPSMTPRRDMPPAAEPTVSEAQLRQMMLGLDRPGQSGSPGPRAVGRAEDDHLMKMMSQVMGGFAPGSSSSSSPFPGMPFPPPAQPQQPYPDGYTVFFRLLHALLAFGLGLYVTFLTPFAGTRLEREDASLAHSQRSADDEAHEQRKQVFFWIFATGEALLLTSRFFLDKGRRPPPGFLWTAVGYLPESVRGYVTVGLKYGQIFTTVRADILACIFVMGVCAWWKT